MNSRSTWSPSCSGPASGSSTESSPSGSSRSRCSTLRSPRTSATGGRGEEPIFRSGAASAFWRSLMRHDSSTLSAVVPVRGRSTVAGLGINPGPATSRFLGFEVQDGRRPWVPSLRYQAGGGFSPPSCRVRARLDEYRLDPLASVDAASADLYARDDDALCREIDRTPSGSHHSVIYACWRMLDQPPPTVSTSSFAGICSFIASTWLISPIVRPPWRSWSRLCIATSSVSESSEPNPSSMKSVSAVIPVGLCERRRQRYLGPRVHWRVYARLSARLCSGPGS